MATNKVLFGLSNVHYAVYDSERDQYGTPTHIPGAVNLTVNREGSVDNFFADNGIYAAFDTNSGFTGTLEIACMPVQALKDLCGYVEMNGIYVEPTDAATVRFALLYEISSNEKAERFAFYDCVLSRPESDANTRTDSTDPDTQSLDITMSPHRFNDDLSAARGFSVEGTARYSSWFTAVQMPTEETSVAA